jgi:hypothetical protein
LPVAVGRSVISKREGLQMLSATDQETTRLERSAASRIASGLSRLGSSLAAMARRALDREARIAARYEGCRWCDSTERKLNADLTGEAGRL